MHPHFPIKITFALTDLLKNTLFVLYQVFSLSLKGSSKGTSCCAYVQLTSPSNETFREETAALSVICRFLHCAYTVLNIQHDKSIPASKICGFILFYLNVTSL